MVDTFFQTLEKIAGLVFPKEYFYAVAEQRGISG